MNFKVVIKNITSIPKVWQMRNLALVGKTTVFKSLAFSKFVYFAFLILFLSNIIEELKHNQKKKNVVTKKLKLNMTLCVMIIRMEV